MITRAELLAACQGIMVRKNHDYTCGSGDPFANFRLCERVLGVDPVIGIKIRMLDKSMRIKTWRQRGALKVSGETHIDAVSDIVNYAILAYGLANNLNYTGLMLVHDKVQLHQPAETPSDLDETIARPVTINWVLDVTDAACAAGDIK